MAKPFYSMDEVCQKLGKSEDEVKQLVRDGSLREFRDAGKIFFKSDEVDKLAGGGAGDEIALEAAPEPPDEELPTLGADLSGGTSVLGLAPVEDEPQDKGKKGGTVISASGIGVFDDDELEIDADPLAATHVAAAGGDQVSLEGSGSGSGLLDLTRESDDTSLGAELLDEIYPGEEESAEPAPPARKPPPTPTKPVAQETAEQEEDIEEQPVVVSTQATAVAGDTTEGMFAGLALGSTILLVLAASVAAALLQGFYPSYAGWLTNQFWFFLGGAVLLPIVFLLVGWGVGRASAR